MAKFKIQNDDGSTKMRGHVTYNPDGSIRRMDAYSSFDNKDSSKHIHEWVKQNPDGSYEYGMHDRDRNVIISPQDNKSKFNTRGR